MNEPDGRFGSLRPARVRRIDCDTALDGVVLADDPLVQLVFHAEELGGLLLGELVDGDARPQREDLGDRLLGDLVEEVDAFGAPLGLLGRRAGRAAPSRRSRSFAARSNCCAVDGGFLLPTRGRDLVFELAVVGRCLHATDAQARAGFVDEVDRLVGKVTVGDVAVGEVGRGHERLVGDGDPVVLLVAVAQALQDLDGVRDRRLLDLDRLEAALERGVLLEVLAVLVERGGTDGLELTAGEHRLEDAGGVDRTFGGARTDERVQLVDEQDDVAAGADLLQHLLEALLEVAAVAGTGDERAEVERVELLALERLGHLAADDVGGEPFDDGGLADARLADEHRVVLGAARQHLHDALDLLLAPDHRVELLVARELREVATELVEHQRAALGCASRRRAATLRCRAACR